MERAQERQQRPPEQAAADQADRRAGEKEALAVAGKPVLLAALAHGAVARNDAAGEAQREPERHLGDRQGEGGRDPEHLDAAREAGG